MTSILFFVSALLVMGISIQTPVEYDDDIRGIVKQFSEAADQQDTALMEGILHTEAQQFFVGPQGLVRLTTPAYMDMLAQKQIGGTPRSLEISAVDIQGNLASVKASMDNDAMHFENFFSLMKIDDEWKIVSVILSVEMK